MALADGWQAQVFYSFQRSALPGSVLNRTSDVALNISYLHVGGRVLFEGNYDESGSYLVGGLGIRTCRHVSTERRPRCAHR